MTEQYKQILVDYPKPKIKRITLNRPEKRNPLSNIIRGEIFDALQKADMNNDIHVTILRGAGVCFSAGYDLKEQNWIDRPYWTPTAYYANWPRHVNLLWSMMADMAKPIIAQVHGYCLAGGSELASSCDLVYVAEDAQIGYPPVRSMMPPDLQYPTYIMGLRAAMEFMLTGSPISGTEAVRVGWANKAFPANELEEKTLEMAERVSKIPPDLQILNKRSVWQAMEIMGYRTQIRAGYNLHTLGSYQQSSREFFKSISQGGDALKKAWSERDGKWGDYRTSKDKKEE
ncbi:MAG: enoyl-CoA hydratase-related protein [Promethearchaeota archaeon]|jgi:enoyl-CoA hydratase